MFTANSAWLVLAVIAFNLTRAAGLIADRAGRLARATTATIRRTLIQVPARLARSARRITLHLPEGLALADRVRSPVHDHAHTTTGNGQLTIAATAARPRTKWTTGMRRPELTPAHESSARHDQAGPTTLKRIGASRLRERD
ncbi:hypothetical protein A8L33_15065 (plasmid) [Microbacterium aurantiacum]|nr:hypothetical protein A8L33_15065 [Microbacterium chocolatum]